MAYRLQEINNGQSPLFISIIHYSLIIIQYSLMELTVSAVENPIAGGSNQGLTSALLACGLNPVCCIGRLLPPLSVGSTFVTGVPTFFY